MPSKPCDGNNTELHKLGSLLNRWEGNLLNSGLSVRIVQRCQPVKMTVNHYRQCASDKYGIQYELELNGDRSECNSCSPGFLGIGGRCGRRKGPSIDIVLTVGCAVWTR